MFEELDTPRVTFAVNVRGRKWDAFAVWWADGAHDRVHWREVVGGVLGAGCNAQGLLALPNFHHTVSSHTRSLVVAVVAESSRSAGRRAARERRFTGLPAQVTATGGAGAATKIRSTHNVRQPSFCQAVLCTDSLTLLCWHPTESCRSVLS